MEDSKAGNIDLQAFKEEIRKRTIKTYYGVKEEPPPPNKFFIMK